MRRLLKISKKLTGLSRDIIDSRVKTAGDLFPRHKRTGQRYLAERGSNRIRRLLERKDDIFYQTFSYAS